MVAGVHDSAPDRVDRISILGTPVSVVSIDLILQLLQNWVGQKRDRYVVLRDVHGIMLAQHSPELKQAHEQADLVAPDGMPLVWTARLSGSGSISRSCGPDLLPRVCEYGITRGWKHYFFGGAPGVTELLEKELTVRFPGIKIVGAQCPPFRSLTEEETEFAREKIRAARPDFVWVGLGTPKQEIWMNENRGKFDGVILLGIGAAFDMHAGLMPRAPSWMQASGLEWAFRLWHEPRRLWRRYLKLAPLYLVLSLAELLRNHVRRIISDLRR